MYGRNLKGLYYLVLIFWILSIIVYVIGRITIMVLAFMTLRSLPADTYLTTNWNNYLPHFAA